VPVLAFLADVVVVVAFAAIGRRSHAESDAVTGVLVTAWPFLTGLAVGWVTWLAIHRRAPVGSLEVLPVWVLTVVVGMVLRHATGKGTAVSFVIVAAIVLGSFLVGWRVVRDLVTRLRTAS
jgi:hypothetical protein